MERCRDAVGDGTDAHRAITAAVQQEAKATSMSVTVPDTSTTQASPPSFGEGRGDALDSRADLRVDEQRSVGGDAAAPFHTLIGHHIHLLAMVG